ncbi:hypothetical protein K8T06_13845 [bacterium]|nr:hypothetical protein [bacterium]
MEDIKILKRLFEELIREERRGQRFFSDAARYVDDPRAKRLFEYLAIEETRHLDVLKAVWKTIADDSALREKSKTLASPVQIIEYAGVAHPVFSLDDKPMAEITIPNFELFKVNEFNEILENLSLESVLEFAMKIEFENTKYIVGFMQYFKNRKYIDLLRKLADDEKDHFIALKKLRTGLKQALH